MRAEQVDVDGRRRRHAATVARHLVHHDHRLGHAEAGAAVFLGHGDAQPAGIGHRAVELVRELAVVVAVPASTRRRTARTRRARRRGSRRGRLRWAAGAARSSGVSCGMFHHQCTAQGAANDFIVLVEAKVLERDDALRGARLAFAQFQHGGARVDRVAREHRLGKGRLAHAQIGDCSAERGVLHGEPDDEAGEISSELTSGLPNSVVAA